MGSDSLMDTLRKLEVSIRESGPVLLVSIRIRSDFSEVLRFEIAKLLIFPPTGHLIFPETGYSLRAGGALY